MVVSKKICVRRQELRYIYIVRKKQHQDHIASPNLDVDNTSEFIPLVGLFVKSSSLVSSLSY